MFGELYGSAVESRFAAAYKGLQALLLRQGAIDFRSGQAFDQIVFFDEGVDTRLVECAKVDASPIIYPFIVIGVETSMRKMEILSIRREHIDIKRCSIFIPKGDPQHG